ncbi:unnamed protein product [Polarella glacialis]|uniref:Uncharacterized protein n=1 Tax=Polarella glacialis TaxID=89957 RepID=A0A813HEG9_POLGL|nr:unnamed protein product [Polarella glacialis]CAE8696143.1 unnamed protein product [Polarella glacialis]
MGQLLTIAKRTTTLPESAPIIGGTLSEEVRLLLLEALPSDEAGFRLAGCEECVDHPACPGHKYMESYFHAVTNSFHTDVDSIHPRKGHPLSRRPAPAPLFAFCEAFRQVNMTLFSSLRSELKAFPNAGLLADVLDRQMHFADISLQVHWGDEVSAGDVAWHVDAPNSFLHLALGLSGTRALHTRNNIVKGRVHQNCLVGHEDEREVLWQNQGEAYLSVPCCFPHAVEYPAFDWDSRIVAVQIRLLLSEDELFGMMGKEHCALDVDPRGGTAAIVFRHLDIAARTGGGLSLPGMEDVHRVLAELQQ